ncbi:MAG: UspA domain protein [Gemmatimonadetes bacterium]|nr:UspA domain protein [Gemmatimonadota bacterium]
MSSLILLAHPTEAAPAMLRLIVVPLDGSPFGEQPLQLAIRIAERQRAEVELVHVHKAIPPYMVQGAPPLDPALDADLQREQQSYLDSIARWVQEHSSAGVSTTVLTGMNVAAALAEHLADRRADLVVMATHGKGGLSRIWIGGVANELVRHSDTPVLLVRPSQSGSRETTAPPFRHVLVPLDGSSADDEAIEHAIAVAGEPDVEFVLLHVVVPVAYLAEPMDTAVTVPTVESVVAQHLEELARRIRARGISTSTRILDDVSPAKVIVEIANELDADLIAMETHARTGVSRLLLGSVTDKVMRASSAPVLVHRRRADAAHAASEVDGAGAMARG